MSVASAGLPAHVLPRRAATRPCPRADTTRARYFFDGRRRNTIYLGTFPRDDSRAGDACVGLGRERRQTVGAKQRVKKQTRDLLFGLGSCRSQVAASLVSFGVRGTPKDSLGDAVAVYLGAVVGSDGRVRSIAV